MSFKKAFASKIQYIHIEKVWKKFLIFSYILLTFTSIYHVIYANKIIPGVKIGSVNVGGKTFNEAKQLLISHRESQGKQLQLRYVGQEFFINLDEINLNYDWDAAVIRAFEVGRTGNFYIDNKDKIAGLVKSLYIGAFYDYNEEVLNTKISAIKGEINKEAVNANVMINEDDNTLTVTQSSDGLKVIDDALSNVVISSFDNISFLNKELPVKALKAQVFENDVVTLMPNLNKIIFNEITIKGENEEEVHKLDQKMLLDLLAFKRDDKGQMEIALHEPRFEDLVDKISRQINELPKGMVLRVDGSVVTDFKLTTEGKELDIKAFTSDFKKAYLNGNNEVFITHTITGLSDKEKFGIYSLIGEGSSEFAGSAKARIHNLSLAAERTNGVLVAPGETYSFNKAVGEISGKTGYDTAYIIQAGRTVLGEGGGVCQTSTTLFRAVLNAGLPVVARYPHAYRVYYYELDSPVGFDASIFQPSLDFQFKNDTGSYILVQSEVDLNKQTLNFKLYGTPDGRKVEISKPVVTNQTAPPEPLYQDDPTLPKGTTKQVDFAAWGANVTFTRKVTKDDELLFEDKFSSRFQPWRAVYLVGTKK